ncbi:leucine-rich repeat-containing protein 45-like, partial [Melanaphis sacchari]|uniref:leucine-rich repeat-containing protein 45-like n=1 Tax=Melanaphis sacchari TaxID=742174 RepID=UPI000DC13F6C
ICNIYRKLCLKNKVIPNEFITSCLYNASVYGEFNLKSTTITEHSCSLIAETLKYEPTINILNLSDCLLPADGLKNFLNLVNYLTNLKILNLKGNQIGNNLTTYISKTLLNNTNITELRLDWNNIGDSVDTFSQFCHSLMSNTVLNTLILANNNLCQACGFYLASMLNINKCLKNIDLSWNCLGETGAELLMKSLKNNEILLELNIQGNSVSIEMSTMIAKKLKQNKSCKINQKEVEVGNLNILEHVNKNYQTQLNILDNQYQNRVE